ncbi:MAG: hypothetical protein RLZZ455_439 [Candidatus Parcubacteria bacterium]|jgi:hypothetical protein
MSNKIFHLLLYLTLIFALVLRVFGINWDQGSHLHPDERAIVLSVLGLSFPQTLQEFLQSTSSWNTHFFAYGSFPFYLLRLAGDLVGLLQKTYAGYDGIQLVGRLLSTLFDLGTIVVLYHLGRNIHNKITGLIASFLYTISVLPIQLSHFYAVDTPLTFFITLLLFLLVLFYEKPTVKKSLLIGIVFGFSLATKISSLVAFSAIGITLSIDFLLLFLRSPHRTSLWRPHIPAFVKKLCIDGSLIIVFTVFTYALLSPYTFIDADKFIQQTNEQSRMTKDAFTFPYTFQYALKTPYLYELKNIYLFGLGPVLGTLSMIGLFIFLHASVTSGKKILAKHIIILTFLLFYFGIVGGFAVGFMRYMLPLYPLFCLFGALTLQKLFTYYPLKNKFFISCYILLAIFLLVWPLSFLHVYKSTHTRIIATEWIHANIPEGKTIALEHWDDGLPLSGIEKYTVLTLPLYEPDTDVKWAGIHETISHTDYIILASNRLYVPLQKLTECDKLPQGRCYVRTTLYYQSLFNGLLGFKKIAEFSSYPTVPILGLRINDQGADESFTVYDHPIILIFKKQ